MIEAAPPPAQIFQVEARTDASYGLDFHALPGPDDPPPPSVTQQGLDAAGKFTIQGCDCARALYARGVWWAFAAITNPRGDVVSHVQCLCPPPKAPSKAPKDYSDPIIPRRYGSSYYYR